MKENKLFELLHLFSRKELKNLRKAVASPLFTGNENAVLLYDALLPYAPDFALSAQDKSTLYTQIFPGEPYRDIKFRLLFTTLVKVIQQFIVHLQTERNEIDKERLTADFFRDRKKYKYFRKSIDRQHELLEEMPMKNMNYWAEKMRLYDSLYANVQHDKYDKTDHTSENLMDAADRFFAFAKVRYGLVLKSKGKIFQSEHPILFREAVQKEYVNGLLKENRLFALYHAAERLTDAPTEDGFAAYERLFFSNADEVTGEDRLFLFFMGLNYAVRQTNAGNTSFRKTALSWYKFALQKNILFDNNAFSNVTFTNIISYACAVGEEDWALIFIDKYIEYLPPAIQKEELAYSYALVYFYQKKYTEVINTLNAHSFDHSYILKTKLLILRSYVYEFKKDKSYFSLLLSKINSLEYYLLRDKLRTRKKKEPYLYFCKILKKAAKLLNKDADFFDIQNLIIKEIEKRKTVAARKWLLEVFAEKD